MFYFEITKDFIGCEFIPSREGRRFGNPKAKEACEKKGIEKIPFKLYDDDKNLYYKGFLWATNQSGDEMFAPLDWAMHDAGATTMKIKENGKWDIL